MLWSLIPPWNKISPRRRKDLGSLILTFPGVSGLNTRLHRSSCPRALMAVMYCSPRTVRLGKELKEAVWQIADVCGRDVIPLLFSRRAHLGRKTIMDLAGAEPDKLRPLIGRLRVDGKLPHSWRRQLFGDAPHITLPRAQGPMVEAIVRRLGLDWLAGLIPIAHESFKKAPLQNRRTL